MTKSKFSTKYLVEMALLVAIILLMAFTPIGYKKTAGLEITLIVIPVAVGAVTLGPAAGAILGGVFGITSFIQCFGMSAFGTLLLGVNPVFTFLVCVPTRILDGWLTGLIYAGLKKTKIPSAGSVTLASLCCPLLNTTFFEPNFQLHFHMKSPSVFLLIILFIIPSSGVLFSMPWKPQRPVPFGQLLIPIVFHNASQRF